MRMVTSVEINKHLAKIFAEFHMEYLSAILKRNREKANKKRI